MDKRGSFQESRLQAVSTAVQQLYNTYPFPPEPLLDEPPPGYNWRWNWLTAYHFCTGQRPPRQDIRILDAGCGTGVSTEYLVHLNPEAQVTGIDISEGALSVARERCQRSGASRVSFHHLSLTEVAQLPESFDLINCVGVLHHLPDPQAGISALAEKLAPGGLMHIFVYAELGRWEIRLMQRAIALLQGENQGDYGEGVHIGRELFATLPPENRLVKREKERWAMENQRDACFADMYVHPQEIDYTLDSLFDLIDSSGLQFVGFSNPSYWNLERLLGQNPELQAKAASLTTRQRYQLVELLDPDLTHYEFFLGREPLAQENWTDDRRLLAALPERSPCLTGWPSRALFGPDYQPIQLGDGEFAFLQACEGNPNACRTVGQILETTACELSQVRWLHQEQLILLSPDPR